MVQETAAQAATSPAVAASGTASAPTLRPLLDRAWEVHPSVSIRPEHFGALLYHFGTRRLSFLKDPRLLDVVRRLDSSPTARHACLDAGLKGDELPTYERALTTLATTDMLRERP